jgi:hypothetical protein
VAPILLPPKLVPVFAGEAMYRGGENPLLRQDGDRTRLSPPTPTERSPFERTGLLLFQPVALCTKPIDFVQHPIQQRFGSSRWNACSLELPNFTALAVWAGHRR